MHFIGKSGWFLSPNEDGDRWLDSRAQRERSMAQQAINDDLLRFHQELDDTVYHIKSLLIVDTFQ
jgi:hypothetical protein